MIFITLVIGLGVHFLQRLGSGVDSNSQFDFNIAVALAVGMAFHQLSLMASKNKESLQALFIVVLLIPLLLAPGMRLVKRGISPDFIEEARWREQCMLETIKKVQATPGNVLTEPYVTYRAAKPFVVDGFNLEERLHVGGVSSTVLLDCIKKKQLTKINVDPNAIWPYDDFNFLRLKSRFQDWPNAANHIP